MNRPRVVHEGIQESRDSTTALAALEAELFLPPMWIQMDRIKKETAVRIRTGPTFAIPKLMITERTPQQRFYGSVAGAWESRRAFVREPWRAPPKVSIEDRDAAEDTHLQAIAFENPAPLIIYTDGSGYEGKVGAAAQIDTTREGSSFLQSQMGTLETATVYGAEHRGLEMAMELIWKRARDNLTQVVHMPRVVVFSDSQAALSALRRPRMPSGQCFLHSTLKTLYILTNAGVDIEFRWIPAHVGIFGNEEIDKLAKEAATSTGRAADRDTTQDRAIILGAAVKARIRKESKEAWEKEWRRTKTAKATRRLIDLPNKKTLEYWQKKRKATTSVMMQLRTGKAAVAAYLAKINARDTPRCECGLGNQSVRHVLLECELWIDERRAMSLKLCEKGFNQLTLDVLLAKEEASDIVADFIFATGVLGQFHAVDPEATGREPADVADTGD
ncbi:reverse transcriptase [Penicillium angulare]|uniref:reverse transcriptase n=1 Tax=Penicillium angulare TaxID=116970 RepID=UPI0025401C5B|nr:reverse transcriptase [Penicillium angulare]KAJ5256522.1 reverse transcriptase [Penicillium angulare]